MSKLLTQSIEANSYSENLKLLIQQTFRTKKINRYEYEKMINILSCQMLHTQDIKSSIESFIIRETNKNMRIDLRA